MIIIGITGPTGSGKTTFLEAVADRGGCVLDLDAVYHELLRTDAALLQAIGNRFPGVVSDGELDRKALGAIVFQDPQALNDLNAVTVPFIEAETDRRIGAAETAGSPLCAVDAINLLEGSLPDRCDCTLAVTAPPEDRVARLVARDSISESYARMRISAQQPNEYFEQRCDYVLRNTFSSIEAFSAACADLLDTIIQDQSKKKEALMSTKKYDEERKKLLYAPKNGYSRISEADTLEMEAYSRRYMHFLDAAKTEREAVREVIAQAEAAGFVPFRDGMSLQPGDSVYFSVYGKSLYLAKIGTRPLSDGLRIAAAHIDNPRLDLKPNPLYEDDELAFMKTHYYGGIKKYQWTTVPMAMHGVVAKKDGSVVELCIGEQPDDPVFMVTDLLIHLAEAQMKKPLATGVTGENLQILVGSRPLPEDEGSDSVKLAVLLYLHETYGICEEDFLSAEISLVPASHAREVGFDRSLIAAFGHDDRSCSYAAVDALLSMKEVPSFTSLCCLADKEEIGSMGITGMQSQAFEYAVSRLCAGSGTSLMTCLAASECISADVTNAHDPLYADVSDKANNSHINYGVCFSKYTGSRGKSGASDAPAEFVAKIRRLCDDGGVIWQAGELGKVDAGGGGTVSQYMANRNILTLDAGVPVLSMHAPMEIVSKLDAYMTRKAMLVFFEDR